jgi:putative DNA primase/helicase
MSENLKRYDLPEIRKATAVLFADVKFGAGECVEVRVIDKKKHLVAAGWFDDLEALAKAVARLARDGFGQSGTHRHIHENAYWTCNPVHDALLARQPKNRIEFVADTSSDNDITRRLWLPIDIDPLRPSGVSATNVEKKLALEVVNILMGRLAELGFPENCFVGGTSGNGYHSLIRIDLPNDNDSRDLIKKCLAAMQGMVGTGKVEVDPKVYNASRIIKCYGTLACKGVNTDERPWRWSRLTLIPEKVEIASKELLEKLAALAPTKNAKRDVGQKRQGPWTVENTQTYIDWTPWECGGQLPGGKPGETAKWLGTCINDENHKDAALILHDDGWWSWSCFHASCADVRHKQFMANWEEEKGENYPYPGKRAEFEDLTAGWEIADVEGETPTVAPAAAGKQAEPKRFNLTDAGNGERLTHRWGNVFRYCTHRGWYYWTGKRWLLDEVEKIEKAALETVRRIPDELPLHLEGIDGEDEASTELRDKITGEVLGWARSSEGKGHLSAAVELCHAIGQGINVRIGVFDQDQWLFNCDNGTLDLRNGEFRAHQQEDMLTNISPVVYDPKADCPLWQEFLETVLAGDQELIAFLQRAAGYSLTGSTAQHCLFMLYGNGRNGKTTFLEVLQHVLGTYGQSTSMEIFLAKNQEGIPNDLAALCNARFVTGVETEDGRRLAEAKVKQITGGDTIAARFLHKEFFQFQPQFKIWIGTNHRPVIRGTDEGIWRRIRLVPFTVYIPDGKVDEKLKDKLLSEASGILNWMLAGLEEYRLGGLMEPEAVVAATDDYRKAEDWLQRFLDAETREGAGPAERTQARAVYERYKRWAEETREYVQSERKFNDAMDGHGVASSKANNKKLYHLVLKEYPENFAETRGERVPEPEEVLD